MNFRCARTTVRQAVTELVQEGWLYRIKSKGTFVTHPKINQDFLKKLESFQEQMKRLGMKPSTSVLELKKMKADAEVAKALQLKEGAEVIFLFRKRFADGEPIVTIKTYLPAKDLCFCYGARFGRKKPYMKYWQEERILRYTGFPEL